MCHRGRGSGCVIMSLMTCTNLHPSYSHFADKSPHVGGVGGKAHPEHNGVLLANKLCNGRLQLLDNGKITCRKHSACNAVSLALQETTPSPHHSLHERYSMPPHSVSGSS